MNRAGMVNGAPSTSLVVEHDRGSLFASLRYARVRERKLEFALTVVNTSDEPLLATADGFACWIDARTEAYVNVPLDVTQMMRVRTVVVRIRGRGIDDRVEADVPRPHVLWALGGAVLVLALVLAFAYVRPTLGSLDVARNAAAGSTVTATYAFGGHGNGVWELADVDGRHVGGGALPGLHGTIDVHLPPSRERKIYLLRVRVDGTFGSASADRVIDARP